MSWTRTVWNGCRGRTSGSRGVSRFARRVTALGRHRRLRFEPLEDRRLLASFLVSHTLDDDSTGSLRWAVEQANSSAGVDEITFESSLFSTPQTITLNPARGQIAFTDTAKTTLRGPAAESLYVHGNQATRVFYVGSGAQVDLSGLTITGGQVATPGGAGILNDGVLTVDHCRIVNNRLESPNWTGAGGGVLNRSGATMNIVDSTISGNYSSGAFGGGLANQGSMTVTRSTISGNAQSRSPGGGLFNSGSVTIISSTISGNSGSAQGGGIFSYYSGVSLFQTTLTGNSDPQIYSFGGFTAKNSIINGSTYGTIDDQGHNLIGVDPLLGPLQDNGGPTWTHAPAWNSPAIDAGDNTGAPATDQRGAPRPQNEIVDIGAYEAMADYGDAPESYGTTLANDGARHRIRSGFHLGPSVDGEPDGQHDAGDLGDDNHLFFSSGSDDEDGVTFNHVALVPGSPSLVTIQVTDFEGTGGYVDAWIDFDGSGTWEADERVLARRPVTAGYNTIPFQVPPLDEVQLGPTFARFRFSSAGNLSPVGFAPDGEVEDYQISIVQFPAAVDYGDAPSPYPTLASEEGAAHAIIVGFHLGSRIDAESPGYPDPHAQGDDNHGDDDEDGVAFDGSLAPGTQTSFTVMVSDIISLFDGLLDAWIDWNQNGSWLDAGEQIACGWPVSHGSNTLLLSIPADAVSGPTLARFRLSSEGAVRPQGFAADGEVEDYELTINAPPVAMDDHYSVDEDEVLATVEDDPAVPGVLANDSDEHGGTPGENNLPLIAQWESGPSHAASFTFHADGTFTYVPEPDFHGLDQFTYHAVDNLAAASAAATVTITVNAVNDPPVLASIGSRSISESQELVFTVSATDVDLPAQVLTYQAAELPVGASFDPATRTFRWTPAEAQGPGSCNVTFTVSDGELESFETITIIVSEINAAPVLAAIGDQSVIRGQPLTFTAAATDEDVPTNSLTFSLDPALVELGMTIAPLTGAFSWRPSEAQGPGSYAVALCVTDSGSPPKTDVAVFTITVLWWQNPVHFADVNADGDVTPDDVVRLVNDINTKDSRSLLTVSPLTPNPPPFLDPSGDGVISPLDVLLVISYINLQTSEGGLVMSQAAGEGENAFQLSGEAPTSKLPPLDDRQVEFVWPISEHIRSPCEPGGQLGSGPTSWQRASPMDTGDVELHVAADRSPRDDLELREIEAAISEIADDLAMLGPFLNEQATAIGRDWMAGHSAG